MNGAPSSSDYNLTQKEILADLADLADFLNETVLPVLQALPDTAAAGLDGSAMYADRNTVNPLFRDAAGNLYTVSQVLSSIAAAQVSVTQQTADLSARILSLQTRLATTQQNDIRASVQSLNDSYTNLVARMTSMIGDVASQGLLLAKTRRAVATVAAQTVGAHVVGIVFTPPFADNSYAVSVDWEGDPGISIASFTKQDGGVGLTVHLMADGTSPAGTLNVLAQAL